MSAQIRFGHGGDALSRRAALARLVAAAGVAAFGTRAGRSQSATAPVGDSTQLADLGMELSPLERAAGAAFLRRHASVDTHCPPGRFFLGHLPYQTPTTRAFGEPFEDRAIEDLNAGNVRTRTSGRFCAATATGTSSRRPCLPAACATPKLRKSWAATSFACSRRACLLEQRKARRQQLVAERKDGGSDRGCVVRGKRASHRRDHRNLRRECGRALVQRTRQPAAPRRPRQGGRRQPIMSSSSVPRVSWTIFSTKKIEMNAQAA
jgi:hypothetical protein